MDVAAYGSFSKLASTVATEFGANLLPRLVRGEIDRTSIVDFYIATRQLNLWRAYVFSVKTSKYPLENLNAVANYIEQMTGERVNLSSLERVLSPREPIEAAAYHAVLASPRITANMLDALDHCYWCCFVDGRCRERNYPGLSPDDCMKKCSPFRSS